MALSEGAPPWDAIVIRSLAASHEFLAAGSNYVLSGLSGRRLHSELNNHHVSWVNQLHTDGDFQEVQQRC